MISYENFDLRIRSDGDGFVVSAQRGSQIASEPFDIDRTMPWDLRSLERAGADVTAGQGAALFDALIHGRVRDLYQQGRGHAQGEAAAGIRFRIIFNPRDERLRPLIRLPWELLRDGSADGNAFPALDSKRPVVRLLETVEHPLRPAEGKLERVLLALASPADATLLNLKREREAVEKALGSIPLKPDVLAPATRVSLYERIADTKPQIVHFMGHSDVDEKTGEGVLLLEDDKRRKDLLPAKLFASFFTNTPAPRLVILTSCQSATEGGQPFAGIAFALVAAGLPAVIAMQSDIGDRNAVRFTERLYRRLAEGDAVEAAVADARNILRISRPESLDWASPVLFLREAGDAIVQEEEAPAQGVAAPASTPQLPISRQPAVTSTVHGSVENQIIAGHIDTLHYTAGEK